jgi:hypothetical protein
MCMGDRYFLFPALIVMVKPVQFGCMDGTTRYAAPRCLARLPRRKRCSTTPGAAASQPGTASTTSIAASGPAQSASIGK